MIREARRKQRLTQAELASRANTSQAVIARLEAGTENPSVDLLWRIALGLNTKLTIGFELEKRI